MVLLKYVSCFFLIMLSVEGVAQQTMQWQCLNYDWETTVADTVVTDNPRWDSVIPIVDGIVWDDTENKVEYDSIGRLSQLFRVAQSGDAFARSDYFFDATNQLIRRVDEIGVVSPDNHGVYGYSTIEYLIFYNLEKEVVGFEEYWLWEEEPKVLLRSCTSVGD